MQLSKKQRKIWTVISVIAVFFLVLSSLATAFMY